MPSKSDIATINNPKLDRRIKLQPAQKEEVKALHAIGVPIREITRRFKVSRRLIQFIIFPERLKHNHDLFLDRGGWEAYYNKEQRLVYMKRHMRYKKQLLNEGKIKNEDDEYCKQHLVLLRDIVKQYNLNPFMLYKNIGGISYQAVRDYLYTNQLPWINKFKPFMEKVKKIYPLKEDTNVKS